MRNKTAILSIFILLSTIVSAQQYHYKLDFSLSKKNFSDTISIDIVEGRVYLPVTINGRTYSFLLDTGAGISGIYSDTPVTMTSQLGKITSYDANGHIYATPVVSLPSVKIGSLFLLNYHANIIHRPPGGKRGDGILGFDIFNKGIIGKIDVGRKHIILTDQKKLFHQEAGYKVRYRLHRHVPYIKLSPFDGYEEMVLFDTGNRSFYTLSQKSFEQAKESVSSDELDSQTEGCTTGSLRVSHYGAEKPQQMTALCLRSLLWAHYPFRLVRTITSQGQSSLGAALFNYGSLIINPFSHRLIFQPYDDGKETTVDNPLPDIFYIPHKNHVAVGLVWEYSKAYKQGFRHGDIILQINGTPIHSFAQFLNYPFVKGQTYTYTVQNERGQTKQIRMTR